MESSSPFRAAGLLAALLACRAGAPPESASVAARRAAPIPSVTMTTHTGARVRFSDLARDRVVIVSFGYVHCTGSCPRTNATLRQVQRQLGQLVGREVAMLTVTLDPEHDTPQVLAEYASDLKAGPGWTFLTGTPQDVDALRRWFGLVDRYDPDAPRTSHAALVVVGDASAGRWFVLPGLGVPGEITKAATRLVRAHEHGRGSSTALKI
jgi:protein SCO1/2